MSSYSILHGSTSDSSSSIVPQYKSIRRCNNYAVLQCIPCSPECKIVGQILLDHPLSYALTATADVPAVYLQKFWRTDREVSPIDISGMVSKEFAAHAQKMTEELFRQHMQNTTLNLMDTSKRGYIPMQEKLDLNKTQGASTPKEVKRYIFILNEGIVDWKSSKQSSVAMSITEAEYIAALEAAMEAVWIMKFISGLGIVLKINEPIKMLCDNSAALLIANEPGVQRGARHYHRRHHYVRECIELGEINLCKVHTDDNLADPFTKALSKGKLTQHARSMGLYLASSFM
ncbi:hypothetical protein Tco_0196071 [Tanacetum coccineum]